MPRMEFARTILVLGVSDPASTWYLLLLLLIFNWPNTSSRAMALGLTQPLTELSTRNLPGAKGKLAHKADNLTAICEPIY
jgi:hypothetical protein